MKIIITVFTLTILFLSCKKIELDEKIAPELISGDTNVSALNARINTGNTDCEDCAAIEASYTDTIDHQTILGGCYFKSLHTA